MTLTVSTHTLAKHFGGTPTVDGVGMAVAGGVVGLLGPNGAGKTTLLRMGRRRPPTASRPPAAGVEPGAAR